METMSVAAMIFVLFMSSPSFGQGKLTTTGTEAKVSSQATEQDIEYVITEITFNNRENITSDLYK